MHNNKRLFLAAIFLLLFTNIHAQKIIPLYDQQIPNSKDVANEEKQVPNKLVDTVISNVSIPTLGIFLPAKKNNSGAAVIICPGGGYGGLLIVREGNRVARAFNQAGVAAFVLKYRLPSDRTMNDKTIGPMQDVQEAMKLVREHAAEWHIDPQRIGVMGFSAGGHLASLAGTHFDHPVIENNAGTSLRPDFLILINPVISFTDSIGHIGSRNALLGTSPSDSLIRFYSSELQIRANTPPAFLVHTVGDSVVPAKNSLYFYMGLQNFGIPAEMHFYQKGEHGFLSAPPFDEWFGRCTYWMKSAGWIH